MPALSTPIADVCLFVEGTYPYVMGGVSSWLHQLISHLPQVTFSICHLASHEEADRTPKYQLPANVVEMREIFLNGLSGLPPRAQRRRLPDAWRMVEKFHDAVSQGDIADVCKGLRDMCRPKKDHLDAPAMLFSEEAWEALTRQYKAHARQAPFLTYFWTFRSTHIPLFALHDADLPRARLYHAVSTGYAGYAAALAKLRDGSPMFITEHGVYTRERDLELALAAWINQPLHHDYTLRAQPDHFQTWWRSMFRFMSSTAYRMSDRIISIAQVNQQFQLRDGAESSKMMVIPNGIDTARFAGLSRHRKTSGAFVVGFVGRVVPIKDVKCFIEAIHIASRTIRSLEAWVVGPTDEDKIYFEECLALMQSLGLDSTLRFSGRADVIPHYSRIDAMVLTSLSEGQPLVILEASAAGIPVVATDVGACRDLLEGGSSEDKALGPSGLVTLPASPQETANALIRLWRDPNLRVRMGTAGQARVNRYYQESSVYEAYDHLYRQHIDAMPVSPQPASATWPE